MVTEIQLGDLVRDRITGLEGIAVSSYEHLNGCCQFAVQPTFLKDGKPIEPSYVDVTQLEIRTKKVFNQVDKKTGGPAVEPNRPSTRL